MYNWILFCNKSCNKSLTRTVGRRQLDFHSKCNRTRETTRIILRRLRIATKICDLHFFSSYLIVRQIKCSRSNSIRKIFRKQKLVNLCVLVLLRRQTALIDSKKQSAFEALWPADSFCDQRRRFRIAGACTAHQSEIEHPRENNRRLSRLEVSQFDLEHWHCSTLWSKKTLAQDHAQNCACHIDILPGVKQYRERINQRKAYLQSNCCLHSKFWRISAFSGTGKSRESKIALPPRIFARVFAVYFARANLSRSVASNESTVVSFATVSGFESGRGGASFATSTSASTPSNANCKWKLKRADAAPASREFSLSMRPPCARSTMLPCVSIIWECADCRTFKNNQGTNREKTQLNREESYIVRISYRKHQCDFVAVRVRRHGVWKQAQQISRCASHRRCKSPIERFCLKCAKISQLLRKRTPLLSWKVDKYG